MKLGMIGLGRMGGNATLHLLQGRDMAVYDPTKEAQDAVVKHGATGAAPIACLVGKLGRVLSHDWIVGRHEKAFEAVPSFIKLSCIAHEVRR
jgi:6-phosphogluconate dehydrogenase (decarboxylating)